MSIFQTVAQSVKLSHTKAGGAVMSLRKLSFYAMLATMFAFAAAAKLNRHLQELEVPEMDTWEKSPSLAGSFRLKSETPPADFIPVQSKNATSLRAGKLLVASRNLGDPYFAKTVILLVRYNDEGVLGLILNRRTDIPISRALEGMKAAKDRSDPVYLGGPVETAQAFALFQSPAKIEGAEPIFDGVYLVSSKPLFERTFSARPAPGVFHVYLGYAAWTQDQLQKEVALGAWFIFPGEASTVFNADPESVWLEMIRKTELELVRIEPGSSLTSLNNCIEPHFSYIGGAASKRDESF